MWQIFFLFSAVPPMVRFFSFSVALIQWCWQTSCVLNIQLLTCLLASGCEFICCFHLVLLIVQDASSPISLSAVASCLLKSKITQYKKLAIGLNISMMLIGALHSMSFSLCVTVMMVWFHHSTHWSQSCMLSDGPAFQSAYIYKCMKVSTKELESLAIYLVTLVQTL
jgi:hypothetical protein